jgi:rhomboid family GlyGly-CTERM serine protease
VIPGGQRARLSRTVHRWPWISLLASLIGLLESALPAQLFAFSAEGLHRGQWWRLWTGHFVHYGSAHLWGDWLAFVVWAALVEAESRRALAITLLIGAPLLLLVLDFVYPALAEYRGLSGIDTALVSELILLRGFERHGKTDNPGLGSWLSGLLGRRALRLVGGFCLCLLACKIGYEFRAGRAILAHDLGPGVHILPAAHVFGAVLGLALGLVYRHSPSKNVARRNPSPGPRLLEPSAEPLRETSARA